MRKNTIGLRRPEDAPKVEKRLRREFPNGMPAYGADALRFTMAAYATLGRNVNFDFKRCEGYRNFCNKLWNATRFVLMNTEGHDCGAHAPPGACELSFVDRWILGALQATIAEVEKGFADYRLDNVAQAVYHFAWDEYCDWYLELAKVQLATGTPAQQRGTRQTLVRVLESLLRLAHPIIPFITEELWQKVSLLAGTQAPGAAASVMVQPYPQQDPAQCDAQADAQLAALRRLVDAARNMRGEMNLAPALKVPMVIAPPGAPVDAFAPYLAALCRLDSVQQVPDLALAGGATAPVVVVDERRFLLRVAVDVGAERERLAREVARLEAEITKAQDMLAKPSFVDKAPPAIVAQFRERIAQFTNTLEKVRSDAARLPPA